MKLFELLNAQPTLVSLSSKKLPAKLAYAVSKNLRLITPELQDFEKARIALLEQYGKLNEETHTYDIPEDKKAQVDAEFNTLVNTDVDLTPFQVDIEAFGVIEITPNEFSSIAWMIRED
jgi:hypothetical protein